MDAETDLAFQELRVELRGIRSDVAHVQKDLTSLDHAIRGNGQPGLLTRTAHLESSVRSAHHRLDEAKGRQQRHEDDEAVERRHGVNKWAVGGQWAGVVLAVLLAAWSHV